MAEEDDTVSSNATGNAAAVGLAMNAGAASEEARTYLREQTELARLQKQNLLEQNAFELSHLRWRRFNDQMKGALQIMAVAVGVLIVAGIGVAMWNARQADGLVVDSFSVPPALASTGTTGDVVADDMTDKIGAIRDFANDHSLARSKDVRQDRDQDIKVEIPETGVSLAQAWRYLKQWLGNERHLNGRIRALDGNRIALTVSLGGADTFSFTGVTADLDKMEQQAAERIFGAVDPLNIILYLWAKGRGADTMAAAQHLVSLGGNKTEMSEAYSLYANVFRDLTGDVKRSVSIATTAIALDPKPAPQHMELLNGSLTLGHNEVVLHEARVIGALRREDNIGSWRTSDGVPYVWQLGAFYRAMETGDFADAAVAPCTYACSLGEGVPRRARAEALGYDFRRALASLAEASAAGEGDDSDSAEVHYRIHAASGDWSSAVSDAEQMATALMADKQFAERLRTTIVRTRAMPLLAYAQARRGDFTKAWTTIAATPTDCDTCIQTRGNIAAFEKQWARAAFWFAAAEKHAPSTPFPDSDWGAMLMAKGYPDGAIAKFERSHAKGPHFADPLEMWGEALIAKNRSDLALAKFEEAAKYAPDWKRLHQKWGEALSYLGRKDEAEKQFAIARSLDG
jgi:tetratricopeptide (TPR) repeat protein